MKTLSLMVLIPTVAFAGGRGTLRALEELQDELAESDAECSKRLGKKLEALASDVEDEVSRRRLRETAREVRSFAEERCPKRLASRVKRALEPLFDDDDDDDRRRSRRRDDDDDDEPRSRRAPARRDCGTGNDPGCTADAMDAIAFRGLLTSLQGNPNELTKLDLVRNAAAAQRMTAAQLGPVLDSFHNELLRLDAARAVVPRLTDPQHALAHAAKWRNSLLASDYSRLLAP